ncbi:hypothetical protein ACLOJK_000663, partial [Asimina triloba]
MSPLPSPDPPDLVVVAREDDVAPPAALPSWSLTVRPLCHRICPSRHRDGSRRRPDLPARHCRDRARRSSSPGLLSRAGMGKMSSVHHVAVTAGWEEDGFVMWVMEHRNRCSCGALGYG